MTDNDPAVQPNPDPVQGGTDPEPSTRMDDDAIQALVAKEAEGLVAKRTEAITRENKRLSKQLEETRLANLSDQDKALEEAEKRGAEKAASEYEVKLRQATIRGQLGRHLEGEALELAAQMAVSIEGEPDEVVTKLQKVMPQLFESTPVGGGGGRNPDLDEAPDYSDPEVLSEKLRSFKTEEERSAFYKKHGPAIEKAQQERVGGVRTWAPGEGMADYSPTHESVKRR